MNAKFFLDYYKGNDGYSDGEIENDILEYLRRNDSVEKVLNEDCRWPVFYHLSPIRENILRWYPFKSNASVLEIGAGMGALTGILCDKCTHVTAVELSKLRGEAIKLRHGHRDNLDIYIGNLNDMKLKKTFNYITLIGVLEYACSFTYGNDPFKQFLKMVSQLLKPDGRLLIAIENRFGLKYWCGAIEDHTGKPFEGINGYCSNTNAKTFDKASLEELLVESGFSNVDFYYPAPDYKLPACVVMDGYTQKYNNIWNERSLYYENPVLTFNEDNVIDAIIKNKSTGFFANSFFIDCGRNQSYNEKKAFFASFTNERKSSFRQYTVIYSDGEVIKRSWSDDGISHLNKIYQNNIEIKKAGIDTINEIYSEGSVKSIFCNLETLEMLLLRLMKDSNINKISELFELYRNTIHKIEVQTDKVFIDLIFSNCFYNSGKPLVFDQEWVDEDNCTEFVLYRAIRYLYQNNSSAKDYFKIENAYELMGISKEDVLKYEKREKDFLNSITEPYVIDFLNRHAYSKWNSIDNILEYKSKSISEKEKELYEKNAYINYICKQKMLQEEFISQKEKELQEKDKYIKTVSEEKMLQMELLSQKEKELQEKDKYIKIVSEEKMFQMELISQKEREIQEKDEHIKCTGEEKNIQKELLSQKERELNEKEKCMILLQEELRIKKSIKRWLKNIYLGKSDK